MGTLSLVRGRLNIARLAILLLLLILSPAFAAQQVSPTITVTINKSMVFRLAERAKRVSVSQPQVADVLVVAPSQLLINGKAVGTTSLIIFDEKGQVTNYDLIVTPDVSALRAQLRAVLPSEHVDVSTSGPAIVLRGEVSNEVTYDKVLEIVSTYLPPKPPGPIAPPSSSTSVTVGGIANQPSIQGTNFAGGGQLAFEEEKALTDPDRWGNKAAMQGVIDMLVIKEIRQVELDVIVAEVSTSKLREIGFDFLQQAGNVTTGSFLGDQSGFPTPLIPPGSTVTPTGTIPFGAATSGIFRYVNGSYALAVLYRLFQNKDVAEILAQPRVVMKNGRSGGFLAGGEVPIVVSTSDTLAVQFKPFGVRLDFVPTITWSDRIDLRVFPEVSEIDPAAGFGGFPGFKVRRSVNRVEMKDGESLVIGGLLDRRILKDLSKFPILGDIPILGTLFRSTRFRNQESELVFVITPRIIHTFKPGEKPKLPSIEKYDDPDIRQVPLASNSNEKKPVARGATIP